MSCNAWNHPSGCDCGWGGINYGSSPTNHEVEAARAYDEANAEQKRAVTALNPFTTPNAQCPACNARVWFYQSPDGGRVFFDHIGWPWPKHPCTDHSAERGRSLTSATGARVTDTDAGPPTRWQENGDRPILRVLEQSQIPSVDIFKSLSRATVRVACPETLLSITWLAIFKIDWNLPVFLREPIGQKAELHTLHWINDAFEGRVIEVTLDRRDVWRHLYEP